MPDRSMERAHLEEAQRHVVEGQQRVVAQRALIIRLDHDGHNVATARQLLDTFETLLAEMITHRDLILKGLAGPD